MTKPSYERDFWLAFSVGLVVYGLLAAIALTGIVIVMLKLWDWL